MLPLLLACATALGPHRPLPEDEGAGDDTERPAPPDSAADSAPDTGDSGADTAPDSPADSAETAAPPSCGAAGGDTCAAADSTACDGLPLLESADCALCCDRSVYPTPAPASFHILDRDDVYSWDHARLLVETWDGPLLCSQNPPEGVDPTRWAQKLNATWYSSGEELADAIHAALVPVSGHPRMVMVDELNSGTVELVDAAARRMAAAYPQWRGHWGVFLVNGESVHFANFQPAIDDLLDAGAAISVELYPAQSTYCASGGSSAARDAWLAGFYAGDGSIARFDWLRARRDGRSSGSDLSVMFGVTDTYLDGTNAAWFLDRQFYVWVTHTEHADLFLRSAGGVGPGAYKWDEPYMGNTSRDLAFYESYEHYVVGGNSAAREPEVVCD